MKCVTTVTTLLLKHARIQGCLAMLIGGPQHVQDLVRTPSGCEKFGCAGVVVVLKAGADGWCGWLAKRRTASREAQ
jgi:hypothetical protein